MIPKYSISDDLLPHHYEMLSVGSGLSDAVIEQRRYQSITDPKKLAPLHFPSEEASAPGLLVPLYNVLGEQASYQYRPDTPRLATHHDQSRLVKYETPHGGKTFPDMHPSCVTLIQQRETPLWITEGAKKADALVTHGQCALCLTGVWNFGQREPGKTQTLHTDFAKIPLRSRQVYIVYDNDVMTKSSVNDALIRLYDFLVEHGAKVAVVRLPWHGEKMGVDDYFVRGGTMEALSALATEGRPQTAGLKGVIMCDIAQTDIEWLWYPYIPRGALTFLDGEPGVGKSLFATWLAARVTRGDPLPDMLGIPDKWLSCMPGNVLLFSNEDSHSAIVVPRLHQAGADANRVTFIEGVDEVGKRGTKPFTLAAANMDILEHHLMHAPASLIVLDPIQAYLGKVDMHRANETRPILSRLAQIADTFHVAVVCLRHPAKGGTGSAIHRGLGSIDLIGAARSGLFIEHHPTNPRLAFFGHHKSNASSLGTTQLFSKTDGVFAWEGVTRATAELIFGCGRGMNPRETMRAYLWLETALGGGLGWPSEDILIRGLEETGVAKNTFLKAKKELGVVSNKKSGTDSEWVWRLESMSYSTEYLRTKERLLSLGCTHKIVNMVESVSLGIRGDIEGMAGMGSMVHSDKSVSSTNSPYLVNSKIPDNQNTTLPPEDAREDARLDTRAREDVHVRAREDVQPKAAILPLISTLAPVPSAPGFSVLRRCPHCESDAVVFFKGTKGVCHACFKQSDWPIA